MFKLKHCEHHRYTHFHILTSEILKDLSPELDQQIFPPTHVDSKPVNH